VLLAYFLGTAAAGSALRMISSIVAAATRRGKTWSFLRAPTLGGMVAHVGVVILALGIVTSTSYTTRDEVSLAPGQSTVVSGQYVKYFGMHEVRDSLNTSTQLIVLVGHDELKPAITTFNGRSTQPVGTPAIDSNLLRDVYVTFDAVGGNGQTSGAQVQNDLPAGSVVLGVTVEPLIAWLWIGGLIIGLGSVLSFLRRRHNDEVAS